MVLALASAVVLSPLYMDRRNDRHNNYESSSGWSSGFVLPMVLGGLIVAIKTTSSSSSKSMHIRGDINRGLDCTKSGEGSSWVLRIGSSSWGLAGVLVMLMFVLSWQHSVQHFFRR